MEAIRHFTRCIGFTFIFTVGRVGGIISGRDAFAGLRRRMMTEEERQDVAETATVTAAMLIIGNEILSGRTKDANLQYLASELTELGIRLMEVRVIPDVESVIVKAVNEVRRRYDYVFTTGGIGPTHDDITAECVAKAFGVPLIINPVALKLLEEQVKKRGNVLNEARLRMAKTPEGASLIDNSHSVVPGFLMETVYVMAGVPRIMQAMFEGLKPSLRRGRRMLSRTVACNLPEGTIAEGLGIVQERFPDLEIGSYPSYGTQASFNVAMVIRGVDEGQIASAFAEISDLVRSHGDTPVEPS